MESAPAKPRLEIPDLRSGSEYLAQLSLASPPLAEAQLANFLDALIQSPPAPAVLFPLLEQARAPLAFVEEEIGRRYHNKAVPLTPDEDQAFHRVVANWRRMERAYRLCASLEQPVAGDARYQALMATLLQRCLYYSGMVIIEHYRSRRELPKGLWLNLHGYYASAEEWGVSSIPVEDNLENSAVPTHCAAAYVALLLVDMAAPYSLSVRNVNLIRRWAFMWAPLVGIARLQPGLPLPGYVVCLMKDAPLHQSAAGETPGADMRRIDTVRLGLQIEHAIGQLRQQIRPSALGLGEETSGYVISLLEQMLKPWTQNPLPRRFRRFPSDGVAKVAYGFEAMHFYVGGKEFEQPDSAAAYSRTDFDQLFTFRDMADPGRSLTIKPRTTFPLDAWSVVNHSASGFRLLRRESGERVAHQQLIVVCPHDGTAYLLSYITWLMQETGGALVAGIATLPGLPQAIGVRLAAANAAESERYVRAFLLPAVSAIKEQASLVLPAGLYQASRILDVFADGKNMRLRMNHVLMRGSDFDRVSYEMA